MATERERAEQAYTLTAHDYVRAPIGSRDWVIYWQGWQAALQARRAEPEFPPGVGVRDAGSSFGGRSAAGRRRTEIAP